MPRAITSGVASTAYRSGAPSVASLKAQLERFQKRLSDCVNCTSANTPQGKADIQAISARISQITKQINQLEIRSSNTSAPVQGAQVIDASSITAYSGLIDVFA